jgi:FtsH-binding integral membrane protein
MILRQITPLFFFLYQSFEQLCTNMPEKKTEIKSLPFYLLLLPVYYVCSKYVQYQGLPDVKTAFLSCLQIVALILLTFALFYLGLRNWLKSSLLTLFCTLIFLFFGNLRIVFQQSETLNFLSQYKFLLPALVIVFFLFKWMIKKEESQVKAAVFFNLLFSVYLLFEIINLFRLQDFLKENRPLALTKPTHVINRLPDIYYLIADCYPSSSYQQEMLGINNDYFEDSLRKQGFHVLKQSKSNYNRTVFSMLSAFNMRYLNIVDTIHPAGPKHYSLAIREIKSAQLFSYLKKADYKIINLSIFDFAGTKALRKENFLTVTDKGMFFSHTFWNYFSRDIYYSWILNKTNYKERFNKQAREPLKLHNKQIIDTLLNNDFSLFTKPVFVYAHINMPHYPYFYDERGVPNNNDSIYGKEMITNKERFAGYIRYTNKQLLHIIQSIKNKTKGRAVIILQSDHGISDLDATKKTDAFRNFTSFYFPDKDYSILPDTMSNVNTFRIILNKYMHQQLPLVKDSIFYIRMP